MATFTTDRPRRTAVIGARVFDGESMTPLPVVVLEGPHIAGISATAPAGTELVEPPGTTLMPGFVDPHVHLAFDASRSWPAAGI
jgi:imidazolonepropionase-like amidohydrolase